MKHKHTNTHTYDEGNNKTSSYFGVLIIIGL